MADPLIFPFRCGSTWPTECAAPVEVGIIDIAAANGGNCELTEADKVVEHNGVKIAGFTNLPARLAADSSQLLAKNLVNLFPLLVGEDAAFAPHWDDEVIKGMALTRDGAIIHPSLTGDA